MAAERLSNLLCSRRLAGQAFAERYPEAFEPPKRYSIPDAIHRVKVKVQIMQRVKGGRVDLARVEEMPQIGTRTGPAGVTGTVGIGGPVVLGVARVLDVN